MQRMILPLLLAVGAVTASFLWQSHIGISIADEGFLWYGAQRVLAGEVPVRDFYSYDPGRYYWIALLIKMLGNDSLIGVRTANALTQAIGLFMALLLIDRSTAKPQRLFLALACITLLAWMYPWFKQIDITISIGLVGGLAFLIQRPVNRCYFLAGVMIGMVGVFSRYHGLYGAFGSLGVMAYLAFRQATWREIIKSSAIWSAGVLVGYLPILLMIAFVPGFWQALWQDIHYWVVLYTMSTHSLLEVPWPWRVPFGHLSLGATVRGVLTGSFFLSYSVFGVLGILWSFRQKLRHKPLAAGLIASAFMALPYANYAYAVPETSHLALGSFPFLIGALIGLAHMRAWLKWPLLIIFFIASLIVLLACHPGYQKKQMIEANIAGIQLKVFPAHAQYFKMLNQLVQDYAPEGRSFLVAPALTTSYSIWKRKAPVHEVYAQFPRGEAFQMAEIERIKQANPGFVILDDTPFWPTDLIYSQTHAFVYKYITEHFDRLHGYTDDPAYQIYKSRRN